MQVIEDVGVNAAKSKAAQIHFLNDVVIAVTVLVAVRSLI